MPLQQVLTLLTKQTELAFVSEETLDGRNITLDAQDLEIDQLMNMIARRLAIEVNRSGDIYYLGSFKPEDRAILVKRIKRLSGHEINTAVNVLLSDQGKQAVYDDGLTVVADRIQVLNRIDNLLNEIEQVESPVWAVQFWLVSVSDNAIKDYGIDVAPSLEIALAYSTGSAGSVSTSLMQGGLDAVLRAADERNDSELLVDHLTIMTDGVEQTFFEGERFPIQIQRVSNEGTSTVTDVQYVDTGIDLTTLLREHSNSTAKLNVELNLSELLAIVNDFAPQTKETKLTSESICQSGGIYLLRTHKTTQSTKSMSNWLRYGRSESNQLRNIMLWARLARIGGPAKQEQESQPIRLPQPTR